MVAPLIGIVVAGAVLVGSGMVVASATEGDSAQIVRVIDGDTFDARIGDGPVERVRLLNVDTPETKDPNKPVECLGPQASAFLEGLLRPGDTVTLTYDEERRDPHGRLLAGVETSNDVFVNSEIAAQGLGVAKLYEPNRRYYDEVLAAQRQAQREQRGLYAPSVACTLPAMVASAEGASVSAAPADPAGMDREADRLAAAAASATAVRGLFDGPRVGTIWDAFDRAAQDDLRRRTDVAARTAQTSGDGLRSSASAERNRRAEADRAAARARADAERQARDEAAAARRAEAAARAEQRRLDAEAARAARAARAAAAAAPAAPAPPAPRASSGTGAYPGYTGPRCYAPGGKSWRPC